MEINWQHTGSISQKNMLSLNENIAKSFRGLLFMTHNVHIKQPQRMPQSAYHHTVTMIKLSKYILLQVLSKCILQFAPLDY